MSVGAWHPHLAASAPRPKLVDSHAHLTDDRLLPDAELAIERAHLAGVDAVITVGTTLEDSATAVDLAGRLPRVWATVGIHPHAAHTAHGAAFAEIERLARGRRVVGIGETGLDYHYDNSPREQQRVAFSRHLEVGRALGLPVVVHCREADEDVRALLRSSGAGTTGVLHCFAGGAALMEEALAIGWYISFAGLITFPRYPDADLVRAVPGDRILVETDSPYLSPVPLRGRRNEPAHVVHTARRAADLRGDDPEEFAAQTARNARILFNLPAL